MRISDWSSDVCSSDLGQGRQLPVLPLEPIDKTTADREAAAFAADIVPGRNEIRSRRRQTDQPAHSVSFVRQRGGLRVERISDLVVRIPPALCDRCLHCPTDSEQLCIALYLPTPSPATHHTHRT